MEIDLICGFAFITGAIQGFIIGWVAHLSKTQNKNK